VNPSYREKDGVYTSSIPVELSLHAVYGKTPEGGYSCFMPFPGRSFFFHDPAQLGTLAEHFARDALSRLAPDELHRLLLLPPPWLDRLVVRYRSEERKRSRPQALSPAEQELFEVAERFPRRQRARSGPRAFPEVAWERGESVAEVVEKAGREKANLLVVGERGSGKSAVLMAAVEEIHRSSRRSLQGPAWFWRTSARRITGRAKWFGEWQGKCEQLMTSLRETNGILWVEAFSDLLRTGGQGPEDSVGAFLAPYLRRDGIQMLAEATPAELEAARTLLPGFTELFRTVRVEEMDKTGVKKVMERFGELMERDFQVEWEEGTLPLSYKLLRRFVKHETFPGKAAAFLRDCLSQAMLRGRALVDEEIVLETFVERTGLPDFLLRDDVALDEGDLRDFFSRRIVGQDEALESVYDTVRVFKAVLNDPGKPVATLVFAGPTGVGKTACARALAEYFFGRGQKTDPLVRLDMSELQHPAQIHRLIGSGAGEPGKLIAQVRERPFCVLLLDEIEKAHPSIFDALLTVLDEGTLLDAYGRSTDFRNAVIVMTTNLGVGARPSIGFASGSPPDYLSIVKKFFRPELFNRIDRVLPFKPLEADVIDRITRKELEELQGREGLVKRGVKLRFSDALREHVAARGFDPRYGARPLQRAVERLVVSALARYLLEHPRDRDCTLSVGLLAGEVRVRRFSR